MALHARLWPDELIGSSLSEALDLFSRHRG